jgi:Cof subfamily protein (haloacid dehalogenase superfamily)
MIKAIATDLDGTLFYPKRKLRLLKGKNTRFLKSVISEGKKLILVTGRNKHVSSKVAKRVGSNDLLIIGCNGALILDNGAVIDEHPISLDKAKELCQLLDQDKRVKSILVFTDKHNLIVDDSHLNPFVAFIGRIGMKMQGVYNEPYVIGKKKFDKMFDDKDLKIYKIMPWFGIGKKGEEIARVASIEYEKSVGDFFEVAWSGTAVEFATKGVTKAIGLNFILSKYGIKSDEVLVAGDSGNDIPLFENFEHSFVMSHAPEEVKCKAKHVINRVADLEEYCKE